MALCSAYGTPPFHCMGGGKRQVVNNLTLRSAELAWLAVNHTQRAYAAAIA